MTLSIESRFQRASLAALAAAASLAANPAHAQSTVTVFGIMDGTVRYVKNGDQHLWSLGSGGQYTSRLGFRGTEDLGGGWSAGFWLESGLNLDTGTPSDATRYWNRRSTVSLVGPFGELRLGRDYTPTYTAYLDYDPFFDNGVAAASKFDSSLGTARDTQARADNQVTYLTPGTLGGFYGRFAVAAPEGTVGKKYLGGRAGYATGPMDVSLAYAQTTVAPQSGDKEFRVLDIAGAYDIGGVKLMGYVGQNKFATQKLLRASLGAVATFGTSQVKAVFIHADASGKTAAGASVDGNDANQLALGYVYSFSKRTAVYTTAAYVRNKGNAAFAVQTSPTALPGKSSTGFDFGLRHNF